ncbi:hypothetical protein BKA62DRAFT_789275 [Auriculariales sp. MPI-PUGE-AT-0066]|nr:hypothetical protein BKA62DRAFT_789275 [Auriculariales sp. MPI-PUGE-AT-0066]
MSTFIPAFDKPETVPVQKQAKSSSIKPVGQSMSNFTSTFAPKPAASPRAQVPLASPILSATADAKPKLLRAPPPPTTPRHRLIGHEPTSSPVPSPKCHISDGTALSEGSLPLLKVTPKRLLQPPPMPLPHSEPSKKILRPLSAATFSTPMAPKKGQTDWKPLSSSKLAFVMTDLDATATSQTSLLASIVEHTTGPGIDDAEQKAMQRGLRISPEKQSRAGRRMLVRNGLADRAESTLDRLGKATVLWQEDMRTRTSRHLNPTLIGVEKDWPAGSQARLMLFTSNGQPPRGTASWDIVAGSEVMVWRPWVEVANTTNMKHDEENPFFESTPVTKDLPLMLCSRFLLRPASS